MSFTNKFYVADTHFQHTNILTMQPRPFKTIEDHDEHIISRWNSVVGPDDIVYHLGDFSMKLTERADRVQWIFSRLNGRKFLVLGNHDVDEDYNCHTTLAALDWEEPPTSMRFVNDGGGKVVLSHYALRTWQWQHKDQWHFYGHSHGHLPSSGRSRDVGVDMPDVAYTPRTWQQLTKGFKS